MRKKEREALELKINENFKIGSKLTLNDKVLTCVSTTEDSWGLRYKFDNGLGFTCSNIISNIELVIARNQLWNIEF